MSLANQIVRACVAIVLSVAFIGETSAHSQGLPAMVQPSRDASENNTWIPIGFNKDRIASMWVQLKSYEAINENSFRVNAKYTNDQGSQIAGRIDLNCKNKDYYFRPKSLQKNRCARRLLPLCATAGQAGNWWRDSGSLCVPDLRDWPPA
jgi:hypothetical protein